MRTYLTDCLRAILELHSSAMVILECLRNLLSLRKNRPLNCIALAISICTNIPDVRFQVFNSNMSMMVLFQIALQSKTSKNFPGKTSIDESIFVKIGVCNCGKSS